MRRFTICASAWLLALAMGTAQAALEVPTDIQQPGTQPREVGNLESPGKCDNCHGGYNAAVEPAYNWRGSMMANAGRDPIFWATLAIAEQDFDGAGDLCIRCHSTGGWLAGHSTPTDGSGLAANDADGVECDFCHKMTNPDDSDPLLVGVMNTPFVANDGGSPAEGYYGSGMYSLWPENSKLGPYDDAAARHQFDKSGFHRDVDFCGTCHDVSNPAVGDLAHNNGAQIPLAGGFSGVPGAPVDGKAAFNNPPYAYGVVERTFSEHKSGLLSQTRVKDYGTLPADLQGGAIQAAYESALVAGRDGDYADGDPRYFSCQTCHLRPVNGPGCDKAGAPVRPDLPLHDMTGGNYWMPDAIAYLDARNKLRLGGGMTAVQLAALADGKTRAMKQLSEAVSLRVDGDVVHIVNQTGHKVISGYPEGRRMWLNIRWMDADGVLVREDGAYGPIGVTVTNPADGQPVEVHSLLDPYDTNSKVYEAHYGLTQEWATQLLGLGFSPDLVLGYDRITGAPDYRLADLAAQAPGTAHESFHFVLNNIVVKDNRIPPYGFSYDEAQRRNALPVPAAQYNGTPGGIYDYRDDFQLKVPANAVYAEIDLKYQSTSWEYVQFLWLANDGQNPFLAEEGVNMLEAWLNTGMAAPYVMASTVWGTAPTPATPDLIVQSLETWSVGKGGQLGAPTSTFRVRDTVAIVATVVDPDGQPLSGAQVFLDVTDAQGGVVVSLQGFSDETGTAVLTWKTGRRQATGAYSGNVTDVLKNGYAFNPAQGVTSVAFTLE